MTDTSRQWPIMTLTIEENSYTYTQPDWDAATDYIRDIGLNPREDVHYVGRLAQLLCSVRDPESYYPEAIRQEKAREWERILKIKERSTHDNR